MIELVINPETNDVDLLVSATPEVTLPLFAGANDVPAGAILSAIAYLAYNRLPINEAATAQDLTLLQGSFENLQNDISGISGRTDGLTDNQTAIRADLNGAITQLASINVTGLQSVTLDANESLLYTYQDGTTKTAPTFKISRYYRGTAAALPTVAGAVGDYFDNVGTLNLSKWVCTTVGNATGGVAPIAVWTARGAPDLADEAFDFDANRAYRRQMVRPMTLTTPTYGGTTSGVTFTWEYSATSAGTTWAAVTWPLTVAAGRILRVTVAGLPANSWATATVPRSA